MTTLHIRPEGIGGLALAVLSGCLPAIPPPPTLGYGAPYKGTGEGIYVKDSRTDWDIKEGHHAITSEQALEAAGDAEYEARRQIAKDYNARLFVEGHEHHRRAYHLMEASGVAIVLGYIAAYVIAPRLQSESITPATATMPEMRSYTSGFATESLATAGGALLIAGIVGLPYAVWGGWQAPPYHVWRTPGPLNRPAYVRQQTEPYNEQIGAPTIPDAETGTEPTKLRPPPGVKPPPHAAARHMPSMRGEP